MPTPTVMPGDPTDLFSTGTGTLSYREDNMSNNESNEAVNPIPENQAELENGITENNTSGGVEAPPICLEEDDIDMELWNKFMETQDRDGVKQSISNTGSDIIVEPYINMFTSDVTRTQKQQRNQQQRESKWTHREGFKRSQPYIPFVFYKELEEDLDDLDQSKQCRYGAN